MVRKVLKKVILFERTSENTYSTSKVTFRGYENTNAGRQLVDGKVLMNRCFDAFIRRFSMFKGESTLNVFQDKTALKQLVDKFSDVKKFDDLDISPYHVYNEQCIYSLYLVVTQ